MRYARAAIEVRFIGPTSNRGARLVATANKFRATIPYPYGANQVAEAHWEAALVLAKKLGWGGRYAAGSTAKGYVFVPCDDPDCIGEVLNGERKEVLA